MARTIITFETLHKVLAAEQALRADLTHSFKCRPTPTPPGLSTAICGMSVELLQPDQAEAAVKFLTESGNAPSGLHTLP